MPSLDQIQEKIKRSHQTWWLLCLIVLSSSLAFGLGRLSALEATQMPIKIAYPAVNNINNSIDTNSVKSEPSQQGSEGKYVGSRSGRKYHLPWCSGAKRIKDENKVWFNSQEAAVAAGYTPAANCPGL